MRCHPVLAVVGAIVTTIGWSQAQAPAFLQMNLLNNSSFTGTTAAEEIYVYFSNGAGASPFPAFDVTYSTTGSPGTAVSFGTFQGGSGNSITFQNYLSNPIPLSTVTGGTFQVTTASSVGVYLAYGSQFSSLSAAPSFLPGGAGATVAFQNFEITRTGGHGDQGNLTNINYFTAPLSITSFSNGVQKQHTSFSQNAQQIATTLRAISPTAEIKSGETTLRFVGPSTYPPANVPPYNSFIPYMQAVKDSSVSNLIQNANAFNTNGSNGTDGFNYNFQFNLNSSFTVDGSDNVTGLVLTGNITTVVKDNTNGTFSAGPTFSDANITIDLTNVDDFNGLVYGQSLGQFPSTVSFESGWSDFEMFVDDPTNDLTNSGAFGTTQAFAIGEITSAILMGFLGNTTVVGGTALNTLPSSDWWKLDPLVAFDEIQSNPDYYNEWANAIYAASNNGAYSIPYSDRLGTGPLVNSVFFEGDYITSWNVGIFDPVPEPSTMALLVVGLAGAAWRFRRSRRA